MSVLSHLCFHDEAAAFEHVERILWSHRAACPHCGSVEKHYSLKGVRSKASKKNPHGVERHGLYKCSDCRKQFTVRMGTIFEETHLPLHKWLQAIHLMCSSKKGISAHQLHRVLEITYKTAWFLAHRIREAMRSDDVSPMGAGKAAEVDKRSLAVWPASPRTPALAAHSLIRTPSLPLSSAAVAPVPSISTAHGCADRADRERQYLKGKHFDDG